MNAERLTCVLPTPELQLMSQRLKALTRDGAIEAAQIRLIGLDEIRQAAGPRWPRIRERVRASSLNILQRHCGPDDVIIAAGDGYLVAFAEGKPGDAQRRCDEMREALLTFYLGEEGMAALRPEVKKHALTSDGLSELIAATLRERVAARGINHEIALAPVLIAHEKRVGAMMSGPVSRAEVKTRRLCHNPDFLLDGRHHKRKDYLDLDIAVLDAALARLGRWKDVSHTSVVGVAVHSSTMQSRRSRESYLHWLADLPPEQRSMLFINIAEIERGTPLISISEWTCALRSFVMRVWLDFHYSDHAIGSVGATGAWAAGFSLPAAQRGPRAERLRRQIRYWSKTLHSQGMRLAVQGFHETALLDEADALGVDLLTSDAHWPFSDIDGTHH